MDPNIKDQFWAHFNVIALIALFMLGGVMLLRVYHYYPDHGQFVEQMVGQILAALLALLTAARLASQRASDANGKGKGQPEPPDAPKGDSGAANGTVGGV